MLTCVSNWTAIYKAVMFVLFALEKLSEISALILELQERLNKEEQNYAKFKSKIFDRRPVDAKDKYSQKEMFVNIAPLGKSAS